VKEHEDGIGISGAILLGEFNINIGEWEKGRDKDIEG
jgi:hypothetical protein